MHTAVPVQHATSWKARGSNGHNTSDDALALSFASLATTILTFAVTLIGVSNTLSDARRAVQRISIAAQSDMKNSPSSRFPSAFQEAAIFPEED